MRHAVFLFIALHISPLLTAGQETRPDSLHLSSESSMLTIRSNAPGTRIFIDDRFVGISPLSGIPITKGEHKLRYLHPDSLRWPLPVIVESLVISADSSIERTVNFPSMVYFTTEPYGASIRLNDSVIGTTPLYYSANLSGQVVTFAKGGYEDASMVVSADGGEVYSRLRAIDGNMRNESALMVSGERSKNLTPIFIASYGTILAGGMAAYFKIQADQRYNEYLSGGDPATLDHVHQLDRFSAIALVTSQLSFIALSYLLLSK